MDFYGDVELNNIMAKHRAKRKAEEKLMDDVILWVGVGFMISMFLLGKYYIG